VFCVFIVFYLSLDFVIDRLFMRLFKLFKTNYIDTVKVCQDYFDFDLPSIMIKKRRKTLWRPIHLYDYTSPRVAIHGTISYFTPEHLL